MTVPPLLPWDYQATNMICCGDEPRVENMGLIDLQDAKVEPITHDMALLLRDIRRGQDDKLENTLALLARRKADRFGQADLGVMRPDDLRPARHDRGLHEPKAAERGAADLRHEVGHLARRSSARTFIHPRLACLRRLAVVAFHLGRGHAIVAG